MTAGPRERPLDVSVIICTRDRAAALRATLASLAAMTVPPGLRHEIIVVDNASRDDTPSVVASFAAALSLRLVPEPRPGLSRARNTGLAHARGRLIFFTDDDCFVAADWLDTGQALLGADDRQIIGGRVDPHDPADLPLTIKTDAEPDELREPSRVFGYLHGCNMIMGARVLDELGPFDPRLGAGTHCRAGEDTDMLLRALDAGIRVRYRPAVRVAHAHGRRTRAEEIALLGGYRVGAGALACKRLLRGRLDALKTIYWLERGLARAGLRPPRHQYIFGAARYLRSATRPDRPMSLRSRGDLSAMTAHDTAPDAAPGGTAYDKAFYAAQRDGSLASARVVIPIVGAALPVASVADVGCGVGTWLRVWADGGVTDYDGYDGDYVERAALLIPAERFHAVDLTRPLAASRRYDLATCLEVGEHLPRDAAETLVASLVGLAPAVLFSAAVPHQGGTAHINEEWQERWRARFAAHGYRAVDLVRPRVWGERGVEWWYQQNTLLYCDATTIEARALAPVPDDRIVNLVHPDLHEIQVDRSTITLRKLIDAFPSAFRQAVMRRVVGPGYRA